MAILLIRIAVGLVFVVHGWDKLMNLENVAFFFEQVNLPNVLVYVVTFVEFVGGLALLLGVLVDYAAVLLAIDMAGAIFVVRLQGNPFSELLVKNFQGGYEFDLTLLLSAVALLFLGSGKYTGLKLIKRFGQHREIMQVPGDS